MARNLTKKFDCIILCEGDKDAEIIKILNNILGLQLGDNVAVTYAGGIRNLYDLAKYISVLARLSRKLKLLGILLDLDDKKPEDRFYSVKNSLSTAGLHLGDVKMLSPQVYNALLKIDDRSLDIKIALMGVMDLPFKRHMIEDHIIKTAIYNGYISLNELNKFKNAKELLAVFSGDIRGIPNHARVDGLRRAFETTNYDAGKNKRHHMKEI